MRALDQQVRSAASVDHLDLLDVSILRQVERGADLPSVIARTLRLDPGRVTRIIDHLVELRYVLRTADAEDRRRCRLQLTQAGEERLGAGKADVAAAMSRVLDGLSEEELAGLESGLEGVRRILDPQS